CCWSARAVPCGWPAGTGRPGRTPDRARRTRHGPGGGGGGDGDGDGAEHGGRGAAARGPAARRGGRPARRHALPGRGGPGRHGLLGGRRRPRGDRRRVRPVPAHPAGGGTAGALPVRGARRDGDRGANAEADAALRVAGHTVEPLPAERTGGRLSVLTGTRLEGDSGLLTRFGSPPARTLAFTVGKVGTSPVRDPVFRVGTSRGVHAPQWQDLPWRGTVEPGGTARVGLPVELAAGAHGDCTVTVTYGGRI